MVTKDLLYKYKKRGEQSWMGVKRNIIIGKVGGNANENSVNYKISLPAKMVKDLGVTKEDRSVILTFENNKIIIKKDK